MINWGMMPLATTPSELYKKIGNIQKAITKWAKEKGGRIITQLKICRDFMGWTDKVEETRKLTILEKKVRAILKKRFLQLTKIIST